MGAPRAAGRLLALAGGLVYAFVTYRTCRQVGTHGSFTMSTRSASHAFCSATLWIGIALCPTTAGAASDGPDELSLFRVRAGSRVLACGGFAGRCTHYELNGTLRMAVMTGAPEDPEPPYLEILDSDLSFTTDFGGTLPFPAAEDLPLAGLRGAFQGGEAKLEAENEHGQAVALRVVELDLALVEYGFLLQGTYDEGCCDRFVYEFGNVVLDPVPGDPTVLLDGDGIDRLAVRVRWQEGEGGAAQDAVPQRTGPNAAQFWFYGPENPEIFVKLVPACTEALEHQVWVFVAGLTDLGVTVTVTDTLTGGEQVYPSPAGQPFATVTDTRAFPCAERLE